MLKKLKLVIIMPRKIVLGYFLLEFLVLIFTKNCHVPQFSVILVNFMSFKQPEVRGVRLLGPNPKGLGPIGLGCPSVCPSYFSCTG